MSKVPGEQFDLSFDSNSSFGERQAAPPPLATTPDQASPMGNVLRFRTRDSAFKGAAEASDPRPMLQKLLRRVSKF